MAWCRDESSNARRLAEVKSIAERTKQSISRPRRSGLRDCVDRTQLWEDLWESPFSLAMR